MAGRTRPAGEPDRTAETLLDRLATPTKRRERLTHVEHIPARSATDADWPAWVPAAVRECFRAYGIERPWLHQVRTAEHAWAGRHVVIGTGTASGKSLGFLLPAAATLCPPHHGGSHTERDDDHRASGTSPVSASSVPTNGRGRGAARPAAGRSRSGGRPPAARARPTVLYLAPTKALAADQLRVLQQLDLPGVYATTFDGDCSREERDWARDFATYLLTNPDMVHRTLLPAHRRWARFLSSVRYVVIDECHHYRGLFGSHVAQVLRRLRRVLTHYGTQPTFVLASATAATPAESGERLTGLPVTAITEDASPHGGMRFALWEPPLTDLIGENEAPVRRSASTETADLLTDLAVSGARTLAFVRSRRGAELVARQADEQLTAIDPELAGRIASYRGGYLADDRRQLEAALQDGRLLGAAATSALELGVDISGLDAVLLAGFPGTRASLWQQAGRAGRAGRQSLAVLVARDDPLDTYLVRHPEALFGPPVEATVIDPDNPYVLRPHLAAAAAELPLTDADVASFGPTAPAALEELRAEGLLRRRRHGWFWARRGRAGDLADLRSIGGDPVRIVQAGTGWLLGTVDPAAAQTSVHPGAVHLHRGESYLVDELDLEARVALVTRSDPGYSTSARELTEIRVLSTDESVRSDTVGDAVLSLGTVSVSSQVVSFSKLAAGPGSRTGQVIEQVPLDLPVRTLNTQAVWWTVDDAILRAANLPPERVPGAAHAAEHAAIGLLPLFATCDRWDIGGVSTALHPDTGRTTVFVYDGHPGGAGFAARGYRAALRWLSATRDAIGSCSCTSGCPSCVQSPKCGNGNRPLDKAGAVRLLDSLLRGWSR